MSTKKIVAIIITALVLIGLVGWVVYEANTSTTASEISVQDAESILNEKLDEIAISAPTKEIAAKNSIKVNSISYGNEKDIIAECTVTSIDIFAILSPRLNEFLCANPKNSAGMFKSALDFQIDFENQILSILKTAQKTEKNCSITFYDTDDGYIVYITDETVNAVYGNLKALESDISKRTSYIDQNGQEQQLSSKNVNKGLIDSFELRYSTEKPDVSNAIGRTWNAFKRDFYRNFIEHDRWVTIFEGLGVTLALTFCALLIGIVLGFLVAFVRCTYLKNTKRGPILKVLNAICQFYLTVIRGTPAVVQITIIYFVIFMPLGVSKFLSAVICFGVNSGAYVAEIVRGGIMSVDEGQTEAGRSLGFGYMQTMYHIVFPQAFKAVLPSLANEFVVLLKETSIAFYIGLGDVMYAVNAIRAATYTPFMPLLAAALIYLVLVLILSKLVGLLERRLRNNER